MLKQVFGKMILLKLKGGLGNQMFQYAFGRSLAERNKTKLIFDTTLYDHERSDITQRDFGLADFRIRGREASGNDLNWFFKRSLLQKVKKRIGRHSFGYIEWENSNYNPEICKSTGNVYLDGYFVSYRYFENIEGIIREEFRLKESGGCNPGAVNENSVAVHMRLGDYIENTEYREEFYICDQNYYQQALSLVKAKVPDARFHLFSDQPEKAREMLKDFDIEVSDDARCSPAQSLVRMSMHKHQIIANSTFSWWAAWLNANPEKIVVSPSRWFKKREHNMDDILPAEWLRI